jgi:hypothetical protein
MPKMIFVNLPVADLTRSIAATKPGSEATAA